MSENMKLSLIITDLTKMKGNRICIAGYQENLKCIRPVIAGGLDKHWLRENQQFAIHPFAIVEFDMLEKGNPKRPHTEDQTLASLYRAKLRVLDRDQQETFLSKVDDLKVENIFGAPICFGPGYYIREGEGERSLGTIGSPNIKEIYYDSDNYRIAFIDAANKGYTLTVTDLLFRNYLDYMQYRRRMTPIEASMNLKEKLQRSRLFFRIGLARGDWIKFPGRCYLQITGVYSFPNYLDDLTLGDFWTE
jgi:hypothetical protein